MSAAILLSGMLLLGTWVIKRIETGVVENAAVSSALYMQSLLEPLTQELASGPGISQQTARSIDALLADTAAGRRIVAVNLWRPDGTIVYSTDKSLTGQSAPLSLELAGALKDKVQTEYQDNDGDVSAFKDRFKSPLFEIYSPMHELGSNKVIAVAEFYEGAEKLKHDLARANWDTWIIAGGLTFVMFSLMYGMVQKAGGLIDRQQDALQQRVTEQLQFAAESDALRQQVQRASHMATELNEQFLRRVGSDLHDGPAQHLALALLKMDELEPRAAGQEATGAAAAKAALGIIRQATADAMREIRNISTGLALPELQKISPSDALLIAAKAHERATGTTVKIDFQPLPPRLPLPVTICLFRFAQEGLNNAYRHAGGKGQTLSAAYNGATLKVEVADGGPGFEAEDVQDRTDRLGLSGLRYRIESIGGALDIQSGPGRGTRLGVRFENPAARAARV
jgi:signal transduction histidine kinase